MLTKLFKQIFRRKLLVGISLVLIATGGYFGYQGLNKENSTTRYVTAAVKKGTLIVSVSGSGQVSASNQVDIKPKVSGDVAYVGVKNGQEVKAGTLLVQIDSRKAQRAVNDAETSLETAKIELEKLLEPVDEYSLIQAENALAQAKDNLTKLKITQESNYQDALDTIQKAEDNLEKAYEDAFNADADAFLDLPTIITGLQNILYGYDIAESEVSISDFQENKAALINSFLPYDYKEQDELKDLISKAESSYKLSQTKYDENLDNYKNTSRYSDKKIIEALLDETLETTKAVAEAVKDEANMLDYWVNYRSQHNLYIYHKVTDYQSDLKSYTSKTNSHLSSLLSIQNTVEDNKEAKLNAERDLKEMEQNDPLDLAAAQRNVKEKEEALAKLKTGPDKLDIQAKKIAIQQKENALLDAQQNLADHYIRAPFDGIVASINIEKGESASSGKVIATLISKQKMAEITLDEIDAAKVKVGQKANITFDAIEDLNITGEVVEVDTLGQISHGVVSYGVKIALDAQDERIKPGMSLSANITTEAKQNTLLVPNSAVKQQGDTSYVQLVDKKVVTNDTNNTKSLGVVIPPSAIKLQQVQVGLSNDTLTEIIDGLKEGDTVITRTITSNSSSKQSQQNKGSLNPGIMRMMR